MVKLQDNLPIRLDVNHVKIKDSEKVVLQDLTIDNCLTFKEQFDMLCNTTNYKLNAFRKIRKYQTLGKAKLLCNAFINSQFNYASMINNVFSQKR